MEIFVTLLSIWFYKSTKRTTAKGQTKGIPENTFLQVEFVWLQANEIKNRFFPFLFTSVLNQPMLTTIWIQQINKCSFSSNLNDHNFISL